MKNIATLGLICLLALTSTSRAQVTGQSEVTSLITPDAVAMLTLRPATLVQTPGFRRFPWEVMSATGLEYLGIDPLKLQRVDLISGIPVPGPAGLPVTVCVTHSEPITPELLHSFLPEGPMTEKGVQLWPIPQLDGIAAAIRGSQQVIIGPKLQVVRLMRSAAMPDGQLRQMVINQGDNAAAQLVLNIQPLRELLVSLAEWPLLLLEPELTPNLTILAEKTRMIVARFDTTPKPLTTYLVEATSEADALQLAEAVKKLISLGIRSGLAALEADIPNHPGRTAPATLAYAKRLAAEVEKQMNFQPSGNKLELRVAGKPWLLSHAGAIIGLTLPAVQVARSATGRLEAAHNMLEIMFAIHSYHALNGALPNDLGDDASTEPGAGSDNKTAKLSWRVHVLPMLNEDELYQQFHLDEPWDSPHNIQLLPRMPALYRDPRSKAGEGYTVYQMPTGQGMVNNPPQRIRMADITDGLSNTIALMMTTDQAAVPWTKPSDFDPVAQPAAVQSIAGVMTVGLADATVYGLKASLPQDILQALITINDGQAVDVEEYRLDP